MYSSLVLFDLIYYYFAIFPFMTICSLQNLFNEVIKDRDCTILCGYRGKEEQEKAVSEGNSKLHYPHSKHNYNPSCAVAAV